MIKTWHVLARFKISVNTNISVFRFYGYVKKSDKYRWIFLHKYLLNINDSKLMEMLRELSKNDKIINNTHIKIIL